MDIVGFVKRYWPSIVPVITAIWALYGTAIQHFVASKPMASVIVAAIYAIVAHLMPSPAATKV